MIGLGAWGLKIFYAVTSDSNTFKIANLIIYTIGATNCLWIVYDLSEQNGLNEFKQFIAWISLSINSKNVYSNTIIRNTFQYFSCFIYIANNEPKFIS